MRQAEDEMSHRDEYDYRIVNDDLDRALEALREIVSGSIEQPGRATME